jgi:hypothetical protein
MPRSSDSLLHLSATPQMFDLRSEVELLPAGGDDGLRESPGGDALLDGLVSDAPLASEVGRRNEPAGAGDRAQGGLDGSGFGMLSHGAKHNILGCVLTTRPRVASIQPMTTSQVKSVDAVVAAIEHTGHVAVVEQQSDGTVRVARVGAESHAVIGKRGAITWGGKGVTRRAGARATIARR